MRFRVKSTHYYGCYGPFSFSKNFSLIFFWKDKYIWFMFYTQVYIIKNIGQVWFRVKSTNYYESSGPFSTTLQNASVRVRMAPEQGHLFHIDAFLVFNKKGIDNLSYFTRKTCCGYSLEVPLQGTSNEYQQHMFPWRNKEKSKNCKVHFLILELIHFLFVACYDCTRG